jgi:hypothetical protein
MKQILSILIALVSILVGVGFVLPALAKLRDFGHLAGPDIGFLLVGVLISLAGPTVAVLVWTRRRA